MQRICHHVCNSRKKRQNSNVGNWRCATRGRMAGVWQRKGCHQASVQACSQSLRASLVTVGCEARGNAQGAGDPSIPQAGPGKAWTGEREGTLGEASSMVSIAGRKCTEGVSAKVHYGMVGESALSGTAKGLLLTLLSLASGVSQRAHVRRGKTPRGSAADQGAGMRSSFPPVHKQALVITALAPMGG